MFVAPPQTITPPAFSVIFWTSSAENVTGARTSIRSAVPPAPVIARELVLGIFKPAAAIMGTTRSEILFPGTPPIECLSTIGCEVKFSFSPVATIALVRCSTSSISSPCIYEPVIYALISPGERMSSTISITIAFVSSALSFPPSIFFRIYSMEAGLSANLTSNGSPS